MKFQSFKILKSVSRNITPKLKTLVFVVFLLLLTTTANLLAQESWNQDWVAMISADWGYMTDDAGDHSPGAIDVVNNGVPLCCYFANSGTSLFIRMSLADDPLVSQGDQLKPFAWMAEIDVNGDGNLDWNIRAAGISEYLETYYFPGEIRDFHLADPVTAGYVKAYQSGDVYYLEMQVPYTALDASPDAIDVTPNTPITMFFHTSTTESMDIKDATIPSTTFIAAFASSGTTTPAGGGYGVFYDTLDTDYYSTAGTWNSGETVIANGLGLKPSTTMDIKIENASSTVMWSSTITTESNGSISSVSTWEIDYSAASGVYTYFLESPIDGQYYEYDSFTINRLSEPEINVTGNSISIADGDNTPSTTDDTDYGTVDTNTGTPEHVFTIQNIGNATLNLSGTPIVSIGGTNPGDFTVTLQPSSSTILSGSSGTFTIEFDPSATGLRSATVSISNDDTNENPFNFTIRGTGSLIPEMDVTGNAISIADGDDTPSSTDETYFGDVTTSSGTQVHTFRIDNSGSDTLNLTGSPLVSISGSHASDFTVTQVPSATVDTSSYTTFEITFDPSALGLREATVSIDNDDLNENPYTFAISGNGISSGTPFSCSSAFRHFNGSSGALGTLSTGSNPFTYGTTITPGYPVNAAGYSQEDGMIYAHERGNTISGDNLIRIDAAGDITVLTVPVSFGADIGDCDDSGNYYFISGANVGKYDISTATLTTGTVASFPVGDMAFMGSLFYGVSGKELYSFNPATNGISNSTLTGTLADDVDGGTSGNAWDAAWTASDGYLYVVNTSSHRFYKIDISSDRSFYAGTGSGSISASDGVSCHSASSPLPDNGTVSDYVWMDFDNDGIQDANEYGLEDVTITLYESDGTQISSTTSDYDGAYGFTGIAPEQYYLIFSSLPANFSFASQDQGSDDTVDSDANASTGQTVNFIVDAYAAIDSMDAGCIATGVGDLVWSDTSQDGIQNAGEPGLAGVTIELLDNSSQFVSSTTSDANGKFRFVGFTPANYSLHFTDLPGGYQIAPQNQGGDDTVDSDPNTNQSKTAKFAVTANIFTPIWDGGLIQTTFPEMRIEGNSTEIVDGDTVPSATDFTDFDTTLVASGSIARTFFIYNTGSVDLSLSGTPMIAISGTHASDFTVTTDPLNPVGSGNNTSFEITFDPSAAGLREVVVSITNNDADENPYNFNIQGVGQAPEMDVQGNSTSIVDGDAIPETTDDTDFGDADITTGNVVHTFTIINSGTYDLALSGSPRVDVSGTHAGDFSVTSQPAADTVSANGGTLTFQVTFDPTGTGLRQATLSIDNDDSDENPYNFAIKGTGTSGPEMDVKGFNTSIADNDNTPSTADSTNFGTVDVNGGTIVTTFTIFNTGSATLSLSGTPIVQLSGTHASDFSVTSQPAADTVDSGGGTREFRITFDPSAPGNRTATVTIANDDSDEAPYNFDILGIGYPYITISDVAVLENAGTATVTVTLNGSSVSGASVEYTTADSTAQAGSDYTTTTNTLSWGSGVSGDKTFTVPILDNGTYEPHEIIKIMLSNITNATFADSLGLITIYDDDGETEISVEGNGVEIPDEDATPDVADHTDFGNACLTDSTVIRTFKIKNVGTDTLNLTDASPFIVIGGSHPGDFSVTSIPSDSIDLGDSTTFRITFNPTATGTRSATISIANDDADESTYNFSIQGTGDPDPAPILVLSKAVDKANAAPGEELTYTIGYDNIGNADATAITIMDPIPANTTFVQGSITAAGMNITYSHNNGASYDGSDAAPVTNIKFSRASALPAGQSGSIIFKVAID